MDLEHRLVVSKSRCSLIADKVVTVGRSSEVWEEFASWLDSGVERVTFDQASALVAAMNSVMDPDDRSVLKRAFIDVFGKPTELTTDRSMEAVDWVRQRVARLNGANSGDTAGWRSGRRPVPVTGCWVGCGGGISRPGSRTACRGRDQRRWRAGGGIGS